MNPTELVLHMLKKYIVDMGINEFISDVRGTHKVKGDSIFFEVGEDEVYSFELRLIADKQVYFCARSQGLILYEKSWTQDFGRHKMAAELEYAIEKFLAEKIAVDNPKEIQIGGVTYIKK